MVSQSGWDFGQTRKLPDRRLQQRRLFARVCVSFALLAPLGCSKNGGSLHGGDASSEAGLLGASVPLRGDAGDGGFSPAEVLNASPPEKPEADGATTVAGHFLLDILEPPPVDVEGYLPTEFSRFEFRAISKQFPQLAAFATEGRTVEKRGAEIVMHYKPAPKPIQIAFPALFWTPVAGEKLVVVAAKNPTSTVIAVFARKQGAATLEASMTFANESMSIVLLYDPNVRTELAWSSCFGCRGEEGTIHFGPERKISIRVAKPSILDRKKAEH